MDNRSRLKLGLLSRVTIYVYMHAFMYIICIYVNIYIHMKKTLKEDSMEITYHRIRRIANLLAHELTLPLAVLVAVVIGVGHHTGDYERHFLSSPLGVCESNRFLRINQNR